MARKSAAAKATTATTTVEKKTLEPGFIGEQLKPGHSLTLENPTEELALQLTTAALDHTATAGRTTLYIATERNPTKIAVCTLDADKFPQWNVGQTFSPMDGEVSFSVEGTNTIHLTGFVDAEMDGDMDPEDDMYGSDDDDQDMLDMEEEMDSEDEGEDDEDVEDSGRFEVIEEVQKGAKKEAEKKEAKKEATPEKKEAKKEATPEKKEVKKEVEKKDAKKRPAEESAKDAKKAKVLKQLKGGVTVEELVIGKGAVAQKGRKVQILYKGTLAKNGKQFDANTNRKSPFAFRLGVGDVIAGFDIGVEGMRVGGKRIVNIPSKMGYGARGAGKDIPGNSDLVFEIELMNA
ncbi:hypothetical protein SPRG_08094 [Saprolegnia parasitica CBS 223.65]|uniref:peptidylprolyl isomerase n=1 Tax=Saprolegnia parasitica (strain CBS 223.65) TaxID=695850 RepID=A0A067C7R6_SAPPC|nr:hypothetical protein SPRG_08094 [Saprolegnia parasitica CBS 223.65]KDO26804.1 hypothetical protein SPRG_08094 [Saprolegnia parasitica CBS 223.65]|eukprot:XP_012202452.1 hypothetical protein SPRG_08094 [Saprolegnia parasitica CBS 223.65]